MLRALHSAYGMPLLKTLRIFAMHNCTCTQSFPTKHITLIWSRYIRLFLCRWHLWITMKTLVEKTTTLTSVIRYWLYISVLLGVSARASRICKRLRSPGIDSNESIPPAYVAWARICKRIWSHGIDSEELKPGESILGLLKRSTNTGPGGPVRQPYSYSVPSPIDCSKIPAQVKSRSITGALQNVFACQALFIRGLLTAK